MRVLQIEDEWGMDPCALSTRAEPKTGPGPRPGGTVAMIGILSGSTMATSPGLIITRQVCQRGVTVGHRDGFDAMLRAIEQHRLQPVVDRVFVFEALKEAMAYLQSDAQFGKVWLAH